MIADSKRRKLEKTAYHEAGHAVIAWLLHRPFVHVSIIPDDVNLGHLRKTPKPASLHPEYERNARTEGWLRGEIMVDLAGPLAEKLTTGRGNWRIGADGDFHHAFDMACYLTCGEAETTAFVRWLWERTKLLLEMNWPIMEALAKELLQRRVIGAKQARALMREANLARVAVSVAVNRGEIYQSMCEALDFRI